MSARQPKRFSAGEEVGGFLIERVIGEGACGAVYKARRLSDREPVALKVLHNTLNTDDSMRARFLEEGTLMTRIREKERTNAFPRVYASGYDKKHKVYYLGIEYLDGRELLEVIAQHPSGMPHAKALEYMVQILLAMAAAHATGVVHRDLKPENIYVINGKGDRPVVRVFDLGIAKDMERQKGDRLTVTGSTLGTPYYMSPEQWRSSENVGTPSDVFALACILYEMLMGKPPFYDTAQHVIMAKVLTMEPDRSLPETIPKQLRDTLMKGLAKDPTERWPDAKAFLDALEVENTSVGDSATRLPTEIAQAKTRDPGFRADPAPPPRSALELAPPGSAAAMPSSAESQIRITTKKIRVFRSPVATAALLILLGVVGGTFLLLPRRVPPLQRPDPHKVEPRVIHAPVTPVIVTRDASILVEDAAEQPRADAATDPAPNVDVLALDASPTDQPRVQGRRSRRDAGRNEHTRHSPMPQCRRGYTLTDGRCCRALGGGAMDCD